MEEFSRQVEELLYESMHAAERVGAGGSAAAAPPSAVEPADPSSMEREMVDLLREHIQQYHSNMMQYHEMVRGLTALLREMRPSPARPLVSAPFQYPIFHRTFSNVRDVATTTPARTPFHRPAPERSGNVGISPEYIRLFTNSIQYDASMNESRCPISLDDFQEGESILQIRGCGHIFKHDSLQNWFQRNHICPVCRLNLYQHHGLQTPRRTPASTVSSAAPISMRGNTGLHTAPPTNLPNLVISMDGSGNPTQTETSDAETINHLLDNLILSAFTYTY
jgi:hypothetical protein